jgi:hypothetical protein
MHPARVRAESLLRIRELPAFFSPSPIDNPSMANCIHGTGIGIDELAPGGPGTLLHRVHFHSGTSTLTQVPRRLVFNVH